MFLIKRIGDSMQNSMKNLTTNATANNLGAVAVILTKDTAADLGVKEVTVWNEQHSNYEDLWAWLNMPNHLKVDTFRTVHIADDYFSMEFNKDEILSFYEIGYSNRKQTNRSKNR
ncbi:hypothetical protein DSECCO2_266320 [anaerobic digester metagenome]